jgi:hypothetical protein
MTRIEDIKKLANEFMGLQVRFFSEMQSLDQDEFIEFMKWFGNRPQNLVIKNFAKSLFNDQ